MKLNESTKRSLVYGIIAGLFFFLGFWTNHFVYRMQAYSTSVDQSENYTSSDIADWEELKRMLEEEERWQEHLAKAREANSFCPACGTQLPPIE